MSGEQQPDEFARPAPFASWQALSGESTPAPPAWQPPPPPTLQAPAPPPLGATPQAPVHGGWQEAWQDEHGQWHAPWTAHQPPVAPPYQEAVAPQLQPEPQAYATPAPVQPAPMQPAPSQPAPAPGPTFVAPSELAPVGPPRYAAPARAPRDPRHNTLAAVLAFVALLVGLWAILGFVGSLSNTLSSMRANNEKLKVQLTTANAGLVSIDRKTGNLEAMAADSKRLKGLLSGINTDMGSMLTGVSAIGDGMQAMDGSLATLDKEMGTVNSINGSMAKQLGGINTGLGSQVASVRTMRRDVQATGKVLDTLGPRLAATNGRLTFVNNAVNTMGCKGITNNLQLKVSVGPIPNGSATVYATVVPPGAWGYQADGVTPC